MRERPCHRCEQLQLRPREITPLPQSHATLVEVNQQLLREIKHLKRYNLVMTCLLIIAAILLALP